MATIADKEKQTIQDSRYSFRRTYDEISREECIALILEWLGEDWDYVVGISFEYERGIVLGASLKFVNYEESGTNIELKFSDGSLIIPKTHVNAFWYLYYEGIDSDEFQVKIRSVFLSMGDYDYKNIVMHKKYKIEENGQAKIAMGTMETLLALDDNKINMLVIGSASENTSLSGLTYYNLAVQLSRAGYIGSIDCYDPYEINGTFKIGEIVLTHLGVAYDFNKRYKAINGEEFTHVIDDSWDKQRTSEVKPVVYDTVKIFPIPEGQSKFVYRLVGAHLEFYAGLEDHREIDGALAGGVLVRQGRSITVTGTSMSYGHYCRRTVTKLLRHFNVTFDNVQYAHGRLCLDPEYKIVLHYPNARISVKYQDEPVPVKPGKILRQVYYTGKERRMLFNVPMYSPGDIIGCGCAVCLSRSKIIKHFRSYSDLTAEEVVTSFLSMAKGKMCTAFGGTKYNNVIVKCMAAAANRRTWEQALDYVSRSAAVSSRVVERALDSLLKSGRISTTYCSDEMDDKLFPNRTIYKGKRIRWNEDYTMYLTLENGRQLYDSNDVNITALTTQQRLKLEDNVVPAPMRRRVTYTKLRKVIGDLKVQFISPTSFTRLVKFQPGYSLGIFKTGYQYQINDYEVEGYVTRREVGGLLLLERIEKEGYI